MRAALQRAHERAKAGLPRLHTYRTCLKCDICFKPQWDAVHHELNFQKCIPNGQTVGHRYVSLPTGASRTEMWREAFK